MIRHIVFFVLLCASATLFHTQAESSGQCGEQTFWTLNNNGTLIISGHGDMKNISKGSTPWRPDLVSMIEVKEGITRLGNNCFNGSKRIQSIKLPSTIKSIGVAAFANCSKLTDIELPEGLTNIEERAFENCLNLTTIKLPETLEFLGERVFNGCKGLISVHIPTSLNSIGSNAFQNCKLITDIQSLPDFINSNNCIRFGLSTENVERYHIKLRNEQMASRKTAASNSMENLFPPVVSDVDIEIPFNEATNANRFAFVIANENYEHLTDVPYALNDGKIFAMYCNYVLGIPKGNIRCYDNATYGNIQSALYEITRVDEAFDGTAEMIVYYVGHGVPDDATREAYIVPSDASMPRPSMCIPLSKLYDTLGNLKSKSSIVFIDACFSGSSRDNSSLNQGERAVGIKPKGIAVSGNVAVISATAGNQTAQPYKEKGHGLFTYFLLKVLKETKGDVTLGSIKTYVSEKVRQVSASAEFKTQSPTANISPDVVDVWEDWKLK